MNALGIVVPRGPGAPEEKPSTTVAGQCLERHGTRSRSEEIVDFEKLSFVHVAGADLQFRGILLPSLSWKSLSTRRAQGADLEDHGVSRRVSAAVERGLCVMHVYRLGAEDCAARRFLLVAVRPMCWTTFS